MTAKPTHRVRTALLQWLLAGNEPLAGDLVEEGAGRSRIWFWRQLTFAVLARTAAGAAAALRDPARLASPLGALAVFVIVSFQVVVAGSLLASVLPRSGTAAPEWLALVVLSSLPAGWGAGIAAKRLRARSRVAAIVLCGGSATLIGLVTHSMLTPAGAVFFPAVGVQVVAAMVFVSGVFAGAGFRLLRTPSVS